MERLTLSYAGWEYFDRTAALLDGRVRPRGATLSYHLLDRTGLGQRLNQNAEFDAGELWGASHICAVGAGSASYVGIPVFPSRMFRHGSVYVRHDSPLSELSQLRGKRVAVGDYNVTAAVWVRGLMQEEYGVAPQEVTWVVNPVSVHTVVAPPAGVPITVSDGRYTLAELLIAGEVDAIISPYRPPNVVAGRDTPIRRLLRDYRRQEQDYFTRTGIFPIMHIVGVRRDVYQRHRWLANSLLDAFTEAKRLGTQRLQDTAALAAGMPWLATELETQAVIAAGDWFPYGFERNRHTLETLCRYVHEQGLTPRRVEPDELFASETLATEPSTTGGLF